MPVPPSRWPLRYQILASVLLLAVAVVTAYASKWLVGVLPRALTDFAIVGVMSFAAGYLLAARNIRRHLARTGQLKEVWDRDPAP